MKLVDLGLRVSLVKVFTVIFSVQMRKMVVFYDYDFQEFLLNVDVEVRSLQGGRIRNLLKLKRLYLCFIMYDILMFDGQVYYLLFI